MTAAESWCGLTEPLADLAPWKKGGVLSTDFVDMHLSFSFKWWSEIAEEKLGSSKAERAFREPDSLEELFIIDM